MMGLLWIFGGRGLMCRQIMENSYPNTLLSFRKWYRQLREGYNLTGLRLSIHKHQFRRLNYQTLRTLLHIRSFRYEN
jgi:hypothetical protein